MAADSSLGPAPPTSRPREEPALLPAEAGDLLGDVAPVEIVAGRPDRALSAKGRGGPLGRYHASKGSGQLPLGEEVSDPAVSAAGHEHLAVGRPVLQIVLEECCHPEHAGRVGKAALGQLERGSDDLLEAHRPVPLDVGLERCASRPAPQPADGLHLGAVGQVRDDRRHAAHVVI